MVEFGEMNEADLRARFPEADCVEDPSALGPRSAGLRELIEHPESDGDFALDLRGSAFELKVWNALREVPAGTTATYGEIAARARIAARGSRSRRSLRCQQARGRGAVSPDREKGRLDLGLSLGRPAQAGSAGT